MQSWWRKIFRKKSMTCTGTDNESASGIEVPAWNSSLWHAVMSPGGWGDQVMIISEFDFRLPILPAYNLACVRNVVKNCFYAELYESPRQKHGWRFTTGGQRRCSAGNYFPMMCSSNVPGMTRTHFWCLPGMPAPSYLTSRTWLTMNMRFFLWRKNAGFLPGEFFPLSADLMSSCAQETSRMAKHGRGDKDFPGNNHLHE